MKKNIIDRLIFGITITLFGITLYLLKNPYWHYPAVIGMWIFFDSLSSWKQNKTTLDLIINKQYKKFALIYIGLFLFGFFIEFVGRILLHLWTYPRLTPLFFNFIEFFIYPFILMSFREMYNFICSLVKNTALATLGSMILGILIWEIPNLFSNDWIYNIPFIHLEIFKINIVVIIGWILLIKGPVQVYKLMKAK